MRLFTFLVIAVFSFITIYAGFQPNTRPTSHRDEPTETVISTPTPDNSE